jgi:hypothetical protein
MAWEAPALRAPEARHIGARRGPVNARNRLTLLSLSRQQVEVLMDPLTPLDTLCRIILRAREYEAQTASDYDRGEDPDNVDDEQEGALSVLEDEINDSVEQELKAAFEDLGEDQLAEVIAFSWVGQGTYEASDWDEAMQEAQDMVSESTQEAIDELMEQPMLASVLESGLAAFDLSCNGIGDLS